MRLKWEEKQNNYQRQGGIWDGRNERVKIRHGPV